MVTDFATWMLENGFDRVFRLLEKRRPGDWTPYQMEQKFSDESQYVSNHYTFVKIVEAVELPGDIMLGCIEILEWEDLEDLEKRPIRYYLLSNIELSFFPEDMKEENWD